MIADTELAWAAKHDDPLQLAAEYRGPGDRGRSGGPPTVIAGGMGGGSPGGSVPKRGFGSNKPWAPEVDQTIQKMWAEGGTLDAIADKIGYARSALQQRMYQLKLDRTNKGKPLAPQVDPESTPERQKLYRLVPIDHDPFNEMP
jgi:hypothetical protein